MARFLQPSAATRFDCPVRRWALMTAVLAPVSLIVGWVVAGAVQDSDYDPAKQTISVLAGHSASDRWIMTLGLCVLGTSQILTAVGLSFGPRRARILLAVGGVMGLGVAIFPQPPHGSAAIHMVFATLSITMLAVWPATIASREPSLPRVLSIRGSRQATAILICLLAWLFVAGHGGGALGIAERVDTAVANSWPLVVILAIRRHSARDLSHRSPNAVLTALRPSHHLRHHGRPGGLEPRAHSLSQPEQVSVASLERSP